jgi:hypothetical protein
MKEGGAGQERGAAAGATPTNGRDTVNSYSSITWILTDLTEESALLRSGEAARTRRGFLSGIGSKNIYDLNVGMIYSVEEFPVRVADKLRST